MSDADKNDAKVLYEMVTVFHYNPLKSLPMFAWCLVVVFPEALTLYIFQREPVNQDPCDEGELLTSLSFGQVYKI